jgi:hypothetical protein
MTGDQQDMVSRLKAVLPLRWFPDDTPVLDSLLNGLAWGWASVYSLVHYARTQARISTAQGTWLDIAAADYFGDQARRRTDESDAQFRTEIMHDLVRDHGTRSSVVQILLDLTGQAPVIFEPAYPLDTGGYAGTSGVGGGVAYGVAGGWGSLQLPFQFFVTAYRPIGSGIALVAGWNSGLGGYGVGAIEYADLSMIQGQITDDDINAGIASVLPVAVIGWTRITS